MKGMLVLPKTTWVLAGTLILSLAFSSNVLSFQPPPPVNLQQVALGWTASPDPTAVGYYLYCGGASGVFTNKINVGTNTAFTMNGLTCGGTYYFTVTAYNSAGVESSQVPEVSYIVPGALTVTSGPGGNTVSVFFPVAWGQSYQLQASSDMVTWSNLWLTANETTNEWVEFDDVVTNAMKFYRLVIY
jgi:hypothetical protein